MPQASGLRLTSLLIVAALRTAAAEGKLAAEQYRKSASNAWQYVVGDGCLKGFGEDKQDD